MRPFEIGQSYNGKVWAKPSDLASALGTTGVDVVSSPATIGYLEMACHHVIDSYFDEDDASVGVGFRLQHHAAAYLDKPLHVSAELIARKAGLLTFRVEGRQGNKLIMSGEHDRALVHLSRFLKPHRQVF